MFAVIKTGGKQYKVAKDTTLSIEKLTANAGDSVVFDSVLMLQDDTASKLGAPLVEGASVVGEVLEQKRGPKIVIFKKKRRKNHRRKNGHRQDFSVVRITDILTDGKKPAVAKKAAPKASEAKVEAAPSEKAAPAKADAPKASEAKAASDKTAGEKKTAAAKSKTAAPKAAAKTDKTKE